MAEKDARFSMELQFVVLKCHACTILSENPCDGGQNSFQRINFLVKPHIVYCIEVIFADYPRIG